MPVAEKDVARAINARTWAQFQLSGVFPDSANPLIMAGNVTNVEIQDGAFKCRSDNPLRVCGEGWERARQPVDAHRRLSAQEQANHDVSVRFLVNRIVIMESTPLRRLLLVASHPEEDLVLVLFPQGDNGKMEIFKNLKFEPIDLVRARAMATAGSICSIR